MGMIDDHAMIQQILERRYSRLDCWRRGRGRRQSTRSKQRSGWRGTRMMLPLSIRTQTSSPRSAAIGRPGGDRAQSRRRLQGRFCQGAPAHAGRAGSHADARAGTGHPGAGRSMAGGHSTPGCALGSSTASKPSSSSVAAKAGSFFPSRTLRRRWRCRPRRPLPRRASNRRRHPPRHSRQRRRRSVGASSRAQMANA